MKIQFGPVLRTLRDERGWTLRELDQKAGVRANHSSVLESRGNTGLQVVTFERYATAFGLSMDDLMTLVRDAAA